MTDLTRLIRRWTDKGWDVVLMLDANEHEDDNKGDLQKFQSDTGLLDAYRGLHEDAPEPASHI